MRLRILPLPTQVDGENVREPYLLILDEVADVDVVTNLTMMAEHAGASGMLVFKYRVELPAVD